MATYVYRITWPDGSISDMSDAHEATREIEARYPSVHVGSGAALAEAVNMAAVQPDGHGCDWVSLYGDEGYRIQVQLVRAAEQDRWRLRERRLQVEHGLSIMESEVIVARERGLRNVDVAREMGITQQAVSNAMSKARAKGVVLSEPSTPLPLPLRRLPDFSTPSRHAATPREPLPTSPSAPASCGNICRGIRSTTMPGGEM